MATSRAGIHSTNGGGSGSGSGNGSGGRVVSFSHVVWPSFWRRAGTTNVYRLAVLLVVVMVLVRTNVSLVSNYVGYFVSTDSGTTLSSSHSKLNRPSHNQEKQQDDEMIAASSSSGAIVAALPLGEEPATSRASATTSRSSMGRGGGGGGATMAATASAARNARSVGLWGSISPRAFVPWNISAHVWPCFHPILGDTARQQHEESGVVVVNNDPQRRHRRYRRLIEKDEDDTSDTDGGEDESERVDENAVSTLNNATLHWTDKKNVLRKQTKTGLFFVKLLKTASSTSVSVHLRLAYNVAREQHKNHTSITASGVGYATRSNNNDTDGSFDICQTRHLHGNAGPRGMRFGLRNVQKSFLWSMLREPTSRYVSEFVHFKVSRQGVSPQYLLHYLQRGQHADQHSLSWLSLSKRRRQSYWYADYAKAVAQDMSAAGSKRNAKTRARSSVSTLHATTVPLIAEILQSYNFIGLVERFDESLVVLSLLLHRPLADVLHISVKTSGSYDDGGYRNTCVQIQKQSSVMEQPHVLDFLTTNQTWLAYIKPEQVLYQLANASLDLTIQALGRALVEKKVALLQRAQQVVAATCRPVLPCTDTGVRIPDNETDCLQGDMGCGFDCLDQVATQLDLW